MNSFGVMMAMITLMSLPAMSESLLADISEIYASDFHNISSGSANNDIDFLVYKLQHHLPSRVELESVNPEHAYDCFLTGLNSGLRRKGNAYLNVTASSKAIFTFDLSSSRIYTQCSWRKQVLFFGIGGTLKAYTNSIEAEAKMSLTLKREHYPLLNKFEVTYMDKIETEIEGGGVLNFLIKDIINEKIQNSRDKIIRNVEKYMIRKIQEVLHSLKLSSS